MNTINLNDRWRVIDSGDKAPYGQWLLQRNKTVKGETRWDSQSFCQTRDALLTAINEKIVRADKFYPGGLAMAVAPLALDAVKSLPARWEESVSASA